MTIWFYSAASQGRSGPVFSNGVTRQHPLLLQADWKRDERITDDPTIISYQRLDAHDWARSRTEDEPLALQHLVDHALEDNQGEIW